MENVAHLPRPMTLDPFEIERGRMRAGQMYSDARTDTERMRALVWVNHWRVLKANSEALRRAGLIA